jgi:hypothetical protein
MNVGNIGQKLLKYGIKAAGVAGAGIVLYDAHKHGQYRATVEKNNKNAIACDEWMENRRNMAFPSKVNSKLKNGIFIWVLRNNIRGMFNAALGYVKGFTGMLVTDVLPLGLSVAAIATKGKAAKISGAALGAYAVYGFSKNVLGIGVKQHTTMK